MTSNRVNLTFQTTNQSLTTLEDLRLPLGEDHTTNATRHMHCVALSPPMMWLESGAYADTVSHAISGRVISYFSLILAKPYEGKAYCHLLSDAPPQRLVVAYQLVTSKETKIKRCVELYLR